MHFTSFTYKIRLITLHQRISYDIDIITTDFTVLRIYDFTDFDFDFTYRLQFYRFTLYNERYTLQISFIHGSIMILPHTHDMIINAISLYLIYQISQCIVYDIITTYHTVYRYILYIVYYSIYRLYIYI